jgi:hypothetical protein
VSPTDELLDLVLVALGEDLHGAVCSIFHPSGEPQPASFSLRGCPKKHPLNAASDE